jgi:hypothetical protein
MKGQKKVHRFDWPTPTHILLFLELKESIHFETKFSLKSSQARNHFIHETIH